MKNTKMPAIRFKGFNDDWEQRKVGEVFEFQYGEFNNNPDNGGEYPIYGANGIIGGYTDWNAENSSIIGHMGAYAGYVVWGEGKHFVTYNGTIARPKDNSIDSKYGYYLLDSKKIYKICAGSGQPFVSYSDLNGIDILLSKDKDEQRLLAYYFTNFDHLITLHQRKLEKIKIMKKSMLEKMFPRDAESIPKIRFDGYTDDWEQRKVCNITTSYSGGTPKSGSTEYYDGDIPFIRSGEIYSDKTELFITELGMKNSSAKMVHEGDILYALYGATSGEVSRAKLDGAINQAILAIIPNDDINANFLVEWFRKEKDKITDTYLQGGQGNLSAQIIKELEVTIPSYDEQNKIGLYFEQLNNLITLHQRKLEKLKKVKKSLLEHMFPMEK